MYESVFIHPASYVPVRFVEAVFRTARRMEYFLENSSKAKRVQEAPSFSDTVLARAMEELSMSLFRHNAFTELNWDDKAKLFKQLRYRFSAAPIQLARVSGIPYAERTRLLYSI